jgi:hypothetical protein
MSAKADNPEQKDDKDDKEKATPSISLPGTVEKIIPAVPPVHPERAQISVEGADHLYKEIRIENTLQTDSGQFVALKPGAEVEVTIEAEKADTIPKKPKHTKGNSKPDPDYV